VQGRGKIEVRPSITSPRNKMIFRSHINDHINDTNKNNYAGSHCTGYLP